MLRSPLKWVGAKSRVCEQILAMFPKHRCYVEVFSGASWVLLGKDPATSKSEVLNDLDCELINFWRVVKHRPAEFAEALSLMVCSRGLFNEWRAAHQLHGDEVHRATQLWALAKYSFGGKRQHFAMAKLRKPPIVWPEIALELRSLTRRLQMVCIEHLPWERCVEQYDSPSTFFYLDPPYRVKTSECYVHALDDEGHARLAEVLRRRVKGKWLLSYNDDAFIRSLFRGRGISIERLRVRYRIQGGTGAVTNELLIRNL